MKRFFLPLLALSVLSSCALSEQGNDSGTMLLTAVQEDSAGTRTELSGTQVLWSEGDAFQILNGSKSTIFTILPEDAGKSQATFSGNAPGMDAYRAFYPAGWQALMKVDDVMFTLPQVQVYSENGFANGANPMVAYSETESLRFKNLCGLFVLQLKGDAVVSSIELTSAASERLWGNASVKLSGSEDPELRMVAVGDEGDNTLKLDCGPGVQLGEEAVSFYFVVPPGTLSEGFSVKISDAAGNVMEKSTTKDLSIIRAAVKRMAPLDFIVTASPFLEASEFGAYNLEAGSPQAIRVYSPADDQLALRSSGSENIFRIQSLVNSNALLISVPAAAAVGDACSLNISSVGRTNVPDAAVSAVLLKSEGGKLWFEDKANKRGYIIAGEL